ncbi:hypothetical protein TNCV_3378161 [Trichonephila clavipes]|nr:hypothetical protein TNCV_3378161 [Trichonephila clavipes]
MKTNSNFSPADDLTRIPLSGTFRLITEKNTPSFLRCPRLMFSATQYPVFPAGYSQKKRTRLNVGHKSSLCKTYVYCLPGIFFPSTASRS